MPRLFFQLHNGLGLVGDDEGVDLPSASAARGHVIDSIRSIMSAEIRGGTLDLTGYVDVTNEAGEQLQRITFMEAFEVSIPGTAQASPAGLPG